MRVVKTFYGFIIRLLCAGRCSCVDFSVDDALETPGKLRSFVWLVVFCLSSFKVSAWKFYLFWGCLGFLGCFGFFVWLDFVAAEEQVL